LRSSAALVAGASLLSGCAEQWRQKTELKPIRACGPAAQYAPTIRAAFVRRKEDYGMLWPGAVYDGQAARRKYTAQLVEAARTLNVKLDLRPEPIYSAAEADAWLAEAKKSSADGLILLLLDRQQHAWPTAGKAVATGIPTVIFSPVGTSFTTNTMDLADRPGCVIYSTDDFSQAAYGMKMLKAGAKIRHSRCVVIKGDRRFDTVIADLGITLHHLPASVFIEEYNRTGETKEILAMADDYIRHARRITGTTRQDVINGVKSYYMAGKILEREGGDAITMDCLGALGNIKVSLPCIAWSRMNDDGIPAAIIGAHCSCPTRLNGFGQPPEPFDIRHHHGNRDAVPRTLWRKGQRVTSIDVLPGDTKENRKTKMLISAGTVIDNVSVPPSGGCVVSVRVKFDSNQKVLSFPGFHQIFFYGDYKQHLAEFCQLFNLQAQLV
jgi:hypothetical protein